MPMTPLPRGPHRVRYEGLGCGRYLTFSCVRRRPLLHQDCVCEWLLEAVARTREKYPFQLWAWVIMPEHMHLLLQPADSVHVASILQSIKQPVARRVVRWAREQQHPILNSMQFSSCGSICYRLWQPGGGYDRNMRSVRDVHEKIAYIHANPARRGLVAHPRDWPWSSWAAWHEGKDGLLTVDRESLPPAAR